MPEAHLVTESNRQLTDRGRRRCIWGTIGTFADLHPYPVLVKADLGVQLGPSYVYPAPAEAATNYELLCSSKQVAQSQSLAAPDIGLHQSSSQKATEPKQPVASLKKKTSEKEPMFQASQETHPKGDLGRHQNLLRQILLCVISTCIAAHTPELRMILTVSQLKG